MTTFALPGAESARVPVDDITIYYETYGAGQPVLLIHGGTSFIGHWAHQLPFLARNYRLIVPEMRGHGRTSHTDRPYSYHLLSEDLVGLLDALEVESAMVVGGSDGAIVGLDMAIHHPERVQKLVAIAANYRYDGVTQETQVALESQDPSGSGMPVLRERYTELSPDADQFPEIMCRLHQMWRNEEHMSLEQLRTIRCRTLLVSGDRDCIRLEHTLQMYRAIPDSELLVIPGASHASAWEAPELTNLALLDFLRVDGRTLLM
jgi:pimeloyl-ACP methyl ester carboxylesterase